MVALAGMQVECGLGRRAQNQKLHLSPVMGTRRKSSRPRHSPLETETLATPAEMRRDIKISRRDQYQTFVALETWSRR